MNKESYLLTAYVQHNPIVDECDATIAFDHILTLRFFRPGGGCRTIHKRLPQGATLEEVEEILARPIEAVRHYEPASND